MTTLYADPCDPSTQAEHESRVGALHPGIDDLEILGEVQPRGDREVVEELDAASVAEFHDWAERGAQVIADGVVISGNPEGISFPGWDRAADGDAEVGGELEGAGVLVGKTGRTEHTDGMFRMGSLIRRWQKHTKDSV